jgi:hypothetical protein
LLAVIAISFHINTPISLAVSGTITEQSTMRMTTGIGIAILATRTGTHATPEMERRRRREPWSSLLSFQVVPSIVSGIGRGA